MLHYDMQERPDLYDDRVRELVESLADCRRRTQDLSEQERRLLDTATIEYATQPPVPSHERKRQQLAKKVSAKVEGSRGMSSDMPEESMPAFWWLR